MVITQLCVNRRRLTWSMCAESSRPPRHDRRCVSFAALGTTWRCMFFLVLILFVALVEGGEYEGSSNGMVGENDGMEDLLLDGLESEISNQHTNNQEVHVKYNRRPRMLGMKTKTKTVTAKPKQQQPQPAKRPNVLNSLVRVTYIGDSRLLEKRDVSALDYLLKYTYNTLTRFDPQRRFITNLQTVVSDAGQDRDYQRFVLLSTVTGTCFTCFEPPGNSTFLLSQISTTTTTSTNQTNSSNTTTNIIQRPPTRTELFTEFSKAVSYNVANGRLSTGAVSYTFDLREMSAFNCSSNTTTVVQYVVAIDFKVPPLGFQEVPALEAAVKTSYNNVVENTCDPFQRRITSARFLGGTDKVGLDVDIQMNSFLFQLEASCTGCTPNLPPLFGELTTPGQQRRNLMDNNKIGVSSTFSLFPSDNNEDSIQGRERQLRASATNASICSCPVGGVTRAPTPLEFELTLAMEIEKTKLEKGQLLGVAAVGLATELVEKECNSNETVEFDIELDLEFTTTTTTTASLNLTDSDKETLGTVIQRSYNYLNFAACDFPYFRRISDTTYLSHVVTPNIPTVRDLGRELASSTVKVTYTTSVSCQSCSASKTSLYGNFGTRRRRTQNVEKSHRNLQQFGLPGCYCPLATASAPLGGINASQFRTGLRDTLNNVKGSYSVLGDLTPQVGLQQPPR